MPAPQPTSPSTGASALQQPGDPAAAAWEARIDLHCHSRFSASPNRWLASEIGLRESYTAPATLYGLAKARGMTHVTLTDHDSIEGALQLAHHDDFFIGEEVTAYFPSEALHVHVLVWGIDETHHEEIGALRFNVFELVEYLRAQGIAHGLSHPFSLVAGSLRGEQLEALLTLFDLWEARNGLSCRAECDMAEDLIARSAALRALIAGPAAAAAGEPAVRAIGAFAGSDDHAGLDVGVTYTTIPLDAAGESPLAALMRGRGRPCGPHGSTAKLAHNGVALIAGGSVNSNGLMQRLMDQAARSPLTWQLLEKPGGRRFAARTVSAVTASARFWRSPRRSAAADAMRNIPAEMFSGDSLKKGVDHDLLQEQVEDAWRGLMREQLGDGDRIDTSALRGDRKWLSGLAEAQSLLAPYLLASGFHARQRRHTAEVAERLAERGLAPRLVAGTMPRVAMFTDTYDDVNGVCTVLHELVDHATAHDWPFTVVSGGSARRSEPGLEVFTAVDSRAFDVYPGFPMSLLPILEVLRWCEDAEVEVIHAATPGPVGMVAWLLASSLDLPLVATYHTDLPNLGFFLTGDHLLKESLWAYVRLFYDQCDIVFCPSEVTRGELAEHRVKSSLQPFPQGIDCELFSPRWRDAALRREIGGGKSVLLWVGRISPEKGLESLAAIYAALLARRDDVHLVIVGEGPGRERLQEIAPQASFLGFKTGAELAAIFASADVFLFPGHTETFGQTVLEAAASGLPAVVTAGSGTEAAMIRDVTALTVAPGDQSGFVAAVERLLDDRELHTTMSVAARRHALDHTWPAAFARLADAYRTIPV